MIRFCLSCMKRGNVLYMSRSCITSTMPEGTKTGSCVAAGFKLGVLDLMACSKPGNLDLMPCSDPGDLDLILHLPWRSSSGRSVGEEMTYARKHDKKEKTYNFHNKREEEFLFTTMKDSYKCFICAATDATAKRRNVDKCLCDILSASQCPTL